MLLCATDSYRFTGLLLKFERNCCLFGSTYTAKYWYIVNIDDTMCIVNTIMNMYYFLSS